MYDALPLNRSQSTSDIRRLESALFCATARKAALLYQGTETEDHFACLVVLGYCAACRRVVLLKIPRAHAVKYGCSRSCLRCSVGRTNPVFKQACDPAVTDHDQSITVGGVRCVDIDSRIAVADMPGDLAARKTSRNLRRTKELLYQFIVDIFAQ